MPEKYMKEHCIICGKPVFEDTRAEFMVDGKAVATLEFGFCEEHFQQYVIDGEPLPHNVYLKYRAVYRRKMSTYTPADDTHGHPTI